MHENCFCGRTAELATRELTYVGDGDWGLTCPDCGHLDRLVGWSAAAREALIAEARRRLTDRRAGATPAVVRAA